VHGSSVAVTAGQVGGGALPHKRLAEELHALVAGHDQAVGGAQLDCSIKRLALLRVIDPAEVVAAFGRALQVAEHRQTADRALALRWIGIVAVKERAAVLEVRVLEPDDEAAQLVRFAAAGAAGADLDGAAAGVVVPDP